MCVCVCVVFRGHVSLECITELCVKQRSFDSRQALSAVYTVCVIAVRISLRSSGFTFAISFPSSLRDPLDLPPPSRRNSWLSIDDSCSEDQQLTVVGAVVYYSYGARLFTVRIPPYASMNMPQRREENYLFIRSGKSEAEVTNNRRLRLTYCTIEANYWQTWSIARPLCDSRTTCHDQFRSCDTLSSPDMCDVTTLTSDLSPQNCRLACKTFS